MCLQSRGQKIYTFRKEKEGSKGMLLPTNNAMSEYSKLSYMGEKHI